jgi:hypothetical protein
MANKSTYAMLLTDCHAAFSALVAAAPGLALTSGSREHSSKVCEHIN